MAMDLLGARLTVLHDAPPANASLRGARLSVLHDAPALNAALIGARLSVLHDAPALNAALIGARLSVLHKGPLNAQSNSDAVTALPNSGLSSPWHSNWDAKRGLK